MQIIPAEIPEDVRQAKLRLGIVGNAPALTAALSRAVRVAPIDLSVLVTGESGTGKEFFPQIIHQYSPRKHGRYIAVNCGAIPEGTIDSELFGHEKGAFTGAIGTRKGYFEEADGGTIFLDEVAELPMTTQARLLRVLETGEFLKVGSSVVQKTNVRIVAATNVDLLKAISEGRFREDLYYRLSTVQISIPPLRDRGNDILLLARKFAAAFAERYKTPPVDFDDSARQLMLHYRWAGNVRQLKNVIEQVALFEAGSDIDDVMLRPYLPDITATFAPAVKTDANHTYDREREMLFNLIFRMQGEIDELRAMVETERRTETAEHVEVTAAPVIEPPQRSLVKYRPLASDIIGHQRVPQEIDLPPAEDVVAGHRTLEDTERETIRMSLERNSGRRKATAAELNISERTLYRKIKEYGLE